jgi:hypothetical protein
MGHGRPIDIIKSLRILDLEVIFVGWNRGWITRDDLVNYAFDQIGPESKDDFAFLSLLTNAANMHDDSIRDLLVRLVEKQPQHNSLALDKWRLGYLLELNNLDLSWNEKVTRLEEIGVEFGFPPDMEHCTHYGPSQKAIDDGNSSKEDLLKDPLDEMQQVIAKLKKGLGIKSPT